MSATSPTPGAPSLVWSETVDGVDWHELQALYDAAPLGKKSAADLQIAFGNSRHRCFVRERGLLVGVGRALADGVDCAYLCDIAVMPSHQGTGLGKAIVQHLLAQVQGHKKVILYAVPGKEPFYKKFGFRRMRTAMAIFEDPARAYERGHIDDS